MLSKFLLKSFTKLNAQVDVLETPLLSGLFIESYFYYKKHIEDPFAKLLKNMPDLLGSGHVIDVGANLGYTATLFSNFIVADKKVFAFEPEAKNFRLLSKIILKRNLSKKIQAYESAVGSESGEVVLTVNIAHHADHRILNNAQGIIPSNSTATVPIVTLDEFCSSKNIIDQVSFVKIDVQGFEPEVFRGMRMLMRANPTLKIAIEYDPQAIRDAGNNPEAFIQALRSIEGKTLYRIERTGRLSHFDPEAPFDADKAYCDILLSEKT